jgi:DNA mismatch repair protein MutL
MTSPIKILPDSLASKIAAGEVVQRPASAVKELIENSIDAHAKSLSVIIKDAGKILIQVIDDGDGMTPEDAQIAFHRHATSKISTYEDLENICTLGFRGEALGSIAAVSHIELRTRTHDTAIGTKVRLEGGTVVEIVEEATVTGTSIQIKNLFFNTPGRRNFLKSNTTEYKHIYDVIQRIAISYPELSIKFISDNETILNLNPSSFMDRLTELFGTNISKSLIQFSDANELMSLNGFLAKPDYARKGRSEQFLFLNRRFILNRNINHAVFRAYEHLLEKGSFPIFVLFLTIDPRKVDVNVHPSKMEVKFENEGSIYHMVLSAVRKTLSMHDLIPNLGIKEDTSVDGNGRIQLKHSNYLPEKNHSWSDINRLDNPAVNQMQHSFKSDSTFLNRVERSFNEHREINSSTADLQILSAINAPLLQIHNKYIIIPVASGIMIVDQHAAHERILYERAIGMYNQAKVNSQQLLFPTTIQMTAGDVALIKELILPLEKLGFNLKIFGNTTVILEGVPVDIKAGKEGRILQEVLDLYKEDDQNIKIEVKERLAKSYACKAAVKAGDPLTPSEMHSLMDQLFTSKLPFVCPHGRPVLINLSLGELDKRFGRTS